MHNPSSPSGIIAIPVQFRYGTLQKIRKVPRIEKSLEIPKNFKASMVEISGIEPLTS